MVGAVGWEAAVGSEVVKGWAVEVDWAVEEDWEPAEGCAREKRKDEGKGGRRRNVRWSIISRRKTT